MAIVGINSLDFMGSKFRSSFQPKEIEEKPGFFAVFQRSSVFLGVVVGLFFFFLGGELMILYLEILE